MIWAKSRRAAATSTVVGSVALAALAAVALAATPSAGDFTGRSEQGFKIVFDVERGKRGSNNRVATVEGVRTLVNLRCGRTTRRKQVVPRERFAVRNSRISGSGRLDGGFRYELTAHFLRETSAVGKVEVRGNGCRAIVDWRANRTP